MNNILRQSRLGSLSHVRTANNGLHLTQNMCFKSKNQRYAIRGKRIQKRGFALGFAQVKPAVRAINASINKEF